MRFTRLLLLLLTTATSFAAQGTRWERQFDETVNVLVLQNPAGRTEVEVVEGTTIHVVAEAGAGSVFDEASISVDQSAPGVVRLQIADPALLHLRVWVPARVVLSIQASSGEITVRGMTSRLLAETQTGNVLLHLPASLDADLRLDTKKGQVVRTGAWAEETKRSDAKGRPVVQVRSKSGTLFLMPLVGRVASAPPPESSGVPLIQSRQQVPTRTVRRSPRDVNSDAAGTHLTSRAAAAARAAASKPSDGRVHVDSDLVLVNAYVVDPQNASVPDLKKEDFAVLDNNAPQEVAIFEPVHRPLDLFLLLDLSGSTHSKFDVVKKAVKKFVDTLAPEDRIAIAAFTSRFMVISDFTSDRKLLKKRMDDTKNRRGGTEFYSSLWNSLDLLAEVPSPRRAIVVMTDGVDNSLQAGVRGESRVSFEDLLDRIRTEGISIYPIYLNTEFQMVVKEGSGDSLSYKEAREQLEAVAEATGTTMFRAERFEDLDGAYERVAAELRNLYTLGFYPTQKGSEADWHDLMVRVNRPGATVRARKGYFVR